MKVIIPLVAIFILLCLIPVIITGCTLIFRSQLTSLEVKMADYYVPLEASIRVAEKPSTVGVIGNQSIYTGIPMGDTPQSIEQVLLEDGTLQDGYKILNNDPGQNVTSLVLVNKILVAKKNSLLEYDKNVLVAEKKFPDPGAQYVGSMTYINDQYFTAIVRPNEADYPAYRELWLVKNDRELSVDVLSTEPYYSERPPIVLHPEGLSGQLLIYYTGSVSYAYGGDSSRPEYSTVRLFNEEYPEGIDLVKFHFKAGTLYDAKTVDGRLVVFTNPSLPSQAYKEPVPVKEWIIEGDMLP